MKIWGIILLVLGGLALLGSSVRGNGVAGGITLVTLGAYLIHCGKQKEKDKEQFNDWDNNKQ